MNMSSNVLCAKEYSRTINDSEFVIASSTAKMA